MEKSEKQGGHTEKVTPAPIGGMSLSRRRLWPERATSAEGQQYTAIKIKQGKQAWNEGLRWGGQNSVDVCGKTGRTVGRQPPLEGCRAIRRWDYRQWLGIAYGWRKEEPGSTPNPGVGRNSVTDLADAFATGCRVLGYRERVTFSRDYLGKIDLGVM